MRVANGAAAGCTAPMTDRSPGARARSELGHTLFADVRWVDETGSTNADLLALARDGEAEGVVLVADHQIAGRGRMGRTWEAPAGASLLCSILLRPPASIAPATTMALAVSMAEALSALVGVDIGLKWPNDLVWPGDGSGPDRKLAGILAELDWPAASTTAGGWSEPGPTERLAVVVGIGLNVAWGDDVPPELAEIAVSLDHITAPAPPPGRPEILVAALANLDRWYRRLKEDPAGLDALRGAWRERSATLGRQVRVDLGSQDLVGTAVDVTGEGHLVVETLEGDRRTVAVGDVVHLRPLGS